MPFGIRPEDCDADSNLLQIQLAPELLHVNALAVARPPNHDLKPMSHENTHTMDDREHSDGVVPGLEDAEGLASLSASTCGHGARPNPG